MTETRKPARAAGLENMSVNSSRRSGRKQDGTENPARRDSKPDSTESTRVPDQQIPRR
jgi:hypothetical protein